MADDYAGSTLTTGTVRVGGHTTGNIETGGDTDWFRVTLTAGVPYQFDLKGSDSNKGTLADPFLRLRDGAGISIKSDDDSGTGLESRITYTPPTTSGDYYLSVGSSSTSGAGTYELRATALTGTATTTATVGTKVSIGRINNQTGLIDPALPIDPTLETWVFVHGLNSSFVGAFNTHDNTHETTAGTTLYDEVYSDTSHA